MGIATRNIIASSGPRQNRKYSIVIPAAGIGNRMKKYGAKPLIKVGSSNIIDRQYKIIDSVFRWHEIVLVTGFQHDRIERTVPSKIKLVHNNDYEETNVVHSIKLGIEECTTNNIIIIYGDLIFNKFAINIAYNMDSLAVIADSMKDEEVGCNIDNGRIEQMFYGIKNKWAQIAFLRGMELDLMKEFVQKEENSNCYGFEAINYIIGHGGKILAVKPNKAKVIDIDSSIDLKRMKEVI
jgi:choline kinase